MRRVLRGAVSVLLLLCLMLPTACGRVKTDFSSPRAVVDTLMAAWDKGDRTSLLDVCGPSIDEWMAGWTQDRCFMAMGKTATYTITKVTNEDDITNHSEVTILIDNIDCYWAAEQAEVAAAYIRKKNRYGTEYVSLTEQLAKLEDDDPTRADLEAKQEKAAATLYKAYSNGFAKQVKRADAVRVQYEVTIAVRYMPMDDDTSGWVLSADGGLGDALMGRDPLRETDES